MKFRKGQKKFDVPPIGELLEVALKTEDGVEIRLSIVHMEEIQRERKRNDKATSWPMMAALAVGAWELHIWPTPHKQGELRVRYYPPAMEM